MLTIVTMTVLGSVSAAEIVFLGSGGHVALAQIALVYVAGGLVGSALGILANSLPASFLSRLH